jgi:hypothetical protein
MLPTAVQSNLPPTPLPAKDQFSSDLKKERDPNTQSESLLAASRPSGYAVGLSPSEIEQLADSAQPSALAK